MTRWIACCAPGRKLITELNCLFLDEEIIEVRESPMLEGETDIILVNADMPELPLPPFDGIMPRLGSAWPVPYWTIGGGW